MLEITTSDKEQKELAVEALQTRLKENKSNYKKPESRHVR